MPRRGGGGGGGYLSWFCFKLGPSAFLNCIPLTNINRYYREMVKKKKQPVKRNEGVVMVTYSTMSCSGLPVSGARLTDHSWPSGRQQNTGWGREGGGEEGRARGEGSLAQAVCTGGHSAQLLSGAFLLSISQPLCVCLVIFSSAANCPDGKTQFRKKRNPSK